MAEPTKEELAARAKAEADARSRAPATALAPAPAPAPTVAAQPVAARPAAPQSATADQNVVNALGTLAEAMKDVQSRINPAAASVATANLDETKPGGFFIVGGKKVNSAGRELNDDGSLKHPEQQRINEFGQLV